MTQEQIRRLYYKYEKGSIDAEAALNDYLYKASPAINKRIINIEKAGLESKEINRAVYFRDTILESSYFPRTLKSLENKTDLTLQALLTINKLYNSNVTVRSIKARNKKTLSSLRKRGIDISNEDAKHFFKMLENDVIQLYLEFDSDQVMKTLEKAVHVDGALSKLDELWQKWRANEKPTYNVWLDFEEWIEDASTRSPDSE